MRASKHSLAFLLGLAACTASRELFNPHRVASQSEAGSVHFAVVSVAPWREYVDALQPRFELSEEGALEAVVPTTRMMQESLIDALQATMGVSTPLKSKTTRTTQISGSSDAAALADTGIDSSGAGGVPPTDVNVNQVAVNAGAGNTKVSTKSEGSAPALAPPATAPSAKPLDQKAQLPTRPFQAPQPSVDPMTRYAAAAALFQEVQLLNRYVRDAAVRQGFHPYVVRLQVSLMPAARNEPYDAYCTCSFFAAQEGAGAPATPARTTDAATLPPAAKRGTPQIIPLMVTDSLEAGLQSRMLDTVRQLAGAIYLMSYNGGVSGDVQKLEESLQSVFGQDLNSLLTVARLSDNTLRVRLGAMQQGSVNHAMVPRNHNVTLLLLVPDDAPGTVQVVSRTTMVDAETGAELPDRTPEQVATALRASADKNGLGDLSNGDLRELFGYAQRNDQNLFFAVLRAKVGARSGLDDERVAQGGALWVDLVSLMVGGQYCGTEFDLPPRSAMREGETPQLLAGQTALVEDDGRFATVVLHSGTMVKSEFDAILELTGDNRPIQIPALDYALDEEKRELKLRFKSLEAWGLSEWARMTGKLRLLIKHNGQSTDFDALYRTTALPPAPNPAGAAAVPPANAPAAPADGKQNGG